MEIFLRKSIRKRKDIEQRNKEKDVDNMVFYMTRDGSFINIDHIVNMRLIEADSNNEKCCGIVFTNGAAIQYDIEVYIDIKNILCEKYL